VIPKGKGKERKALTWGRPLYSTRKKKGGEAKERRKEGVVRFNGGKTTDIEKRKVDVVQKGGEESGVTASQWFCP